MYVVLLTAIKLVALLPVATHPNHMASDLVNRDDVRQLDARGLAIFLVLKARQVIVNLELQQRHLLIITTRGHNAQHAILFLLDHVLARVRHGLRLGSIQVLATDHGPAISIHAHRDAVRDPVALTHDARTVVRDVQVLRQHQRTGHAALVLAVVHLLEG